MLHPRARLIWTLCNVACAFAYLWAASPTWLEPELRGEEVGRVGDAFIWFIGAAPILALALVSNLIWFALILWERRKTGAPWPRATLATIAVTWALALAIDEARSLGY